MTNKRKVIIVLAGDANQAKNYIKSEPNMIYAAFPKDILGVIAERVDIIGTFWERDDAQEMRDLALSRVM